MFTGLPTERSVFAGNDPSVRRQDRSSTSPSSPDAGPPTRRRAIAKTTSGFMLSVDDERWNTATLQTLRARPGLVPVVKGNGYGFGLRLLSERCDRLGVDTVAVATHAEALVVGSSFSGTVLIMSPVGPEGIDESVHRPAMIRTVAHPQVLRNLADASRRDVQVVVELDSPVHRHGMDVADLIALAPHLRRLRFRGLSMHLPVGGDRRSVLHSVSRTIAAVDAAGIGVGTLWLSHVSADEVARLERAFPQLTIRTRVGTDLWLADRGAFTASGTVLDVHAINPGQRVGYQQRRVRGGSLLIVAGGTAHGVGVAAQPARSTLRRAALEAARVGAFGTGCLPSPFRLHGKRLPYADVAHMQVSMLVVPPRTSPPSIGDRLPCEVRMTLSAFDRIELRAAASPTR